MHFETRSLWQTKSTELQSIKTCWTQICDVIICMRIQDLWGKSQLGSHLETVFISRFLRCKWAVIRLEYTHLHIDRHIQCNKQFFDLLAITSRLEKMKSLNNLRDSVSFNIIKFIEKSGESSFVTANFSCFAKFSRKTRVIYITCRRVQRFYFIIFMFCYIIVFSLLSVSNKSISTAQSHARECFWY